MSYVRVPPDSTGKKVYTIEQTIGADTVQTQVTHLADKKYPTQFQAIDKRGSSSVRFAEGQPILSGFGSLKVVEQKALGVYESSQDSYDDLFSITESVGGLSTYDVGASSTVLSVTGSNGSHAVRTTNRYHYYLPGTSNAAIMTIACGDTGKTGNVRRWGCFDDNDGIFFELYGTTINAVIRNSTSGSVVETKIPQSLWNGDIVDGTGWSGHTLDITKINVWWMDYQWLGAGRVRFGIFEPSGARLVLHSVENAGQNPLPYMRTGTLPLRTENVNIAAVGSSSELREVCMAMYAEGDFTTYTFWRNADLERTGATVGATTTHVMSVRSKPTINGLHNAIQSYPELLSIYTTQPIALSLHQETSLTGASWGITGVGSLDATIDGTLTIPPESSFQVWYLDAGTHNISLTQYFELNDEGIMCKANGVPTVWSFVAKKLGATDATVSLNLGYRELW